MQMQRQDCHWLLGPPGNKVQALRVAAVHFLPPSPSSKDADNVVDRKHAVNSLPCVRGQDARVQIERIDRFQERCRWVWTERKKRRLLGNMCVQRSRVTPCPSHSRDDAVIKRRLATQRQNQPPLVNFTIDRKMLV